MPQDEQSGIQQGYLNRLGAAVSSVASSVAGHLSRPTYGPGDRPASSVPGYTSDLLAPIPSMAPAYDSIRRPLYTPTPAPQRHGASQLPPPTMGSQSGSGPHRHNGHDRPSTSSVRGKGRDHGRDDGWEPNAGGFHGSTGDRATHQASGPYERVSSVYDVDMASAKAISDRAQHMIDDLDRRCANFKRALCQPDEPSLTFLLPCVCAMP
jgi:hypothetical protein